MKHYLDSLTETMNASWKEKALCDWHGDEFTFEEVAVQIERLHIIFNEGGLGKGDKVALCAQNSARWAISFLAVNTYETIVVPLLSNFTAEGICRLVDHSGSIVLFTDRDIWAKLDTGKMPSLRAAVCVDDFSLLWSSDRKISEAFAAAGSLFAEKYPDGFRKEYVKYPSGNDRELAVINYTSGTTSFPKGVMLRYECFSSSIDFAIRHIKCSSKDSILSMLPMGHIYGLVFEFLYPLCHGAKVCFLGKTPSASTLMKAVSEVKPYIVVTVPLVMEKICKSAIKPVLDKPAVKVIERIPLLDKILHRIICKKIISAFGGNVVAFIMGGAALNPEVENILKRIGLPYTVGYGMTEATPLLAYAHPSDYIPGTCGRSVDTAEVRIDSEDPEHIPGEIQAKGSNICSGYFNNREATADAFTDDGFLRTGDLGTMDRYGNITICGRSKNLILTANGQNIFPEEVEAMINSQDYVLESLVVEKSSKLVALVLLDEPAIRKIGLNPEILSHLPERIRTACNKRLPAYSQISRVELVDKPFEKTPKLSIKRYLYK
ncbi:MAG: AMP-binding protein [Bacteroidales bacterium]|nr:AMP-binding protein [Candidatus Cacconaster equi]